MVGLINARIPNTSIGLGLVINIGAEVNKFKPSKVLLVTDKGIVKAGLLESVIFSLDQANVKYGIFDDCLPEPTIDIVQSLITTIRSGGYDLLIGIGGGSIMDATKVASVYTYGDMGLSDFMKAPRGTIVHGKIIPKVLVPTTAGTGSEWSTAVVLYDNNRLGFLGLMEQYGADRVIIDPEMTKNLPPKITAETGFDALTHAIESYISRNANIFSETLAGLAIKLIGENLQRAFSKGANDIEARYNMSLAAALAMNAGTSSGLGMGHPMGEYVQSKGNISHGASLAIVLPAVMDFNLDANPQKFINIAELMGENITNLSIHEAACKSVKAVTDLIINFELPKRMSEVGILDADIDEMAKHCFETSAMLMKMCSPREPSESDIKQIFKSIL